MFLVRGDGLKEELINFLREEEMDGYMIYADSATDSDLYYLTRFLAHDPFLYLHTLEREMVLVSTLEARRAEREASVDEIVTTERYGMRELVKSGVSRAEAYVEVVRGLLQDAFDGESGVRIAVPQSFEVYLADRLREDREIIPRISPLRAMRARKRRDEVALIIDAERRAEEALGLAEERLKEAEVRGGRLYLKGEVLTSERLRGIIDMSLLSNGYETEATIVACGTQSAEPHNIGSGPLESDKPIVIDIFPRHKTNRYHADLTRTFVLGTPDPEVIEMHSAVLDAQEKAIEVIQPGVTGSEVHETVTRVLESHGYESGDEGFIHSTGHGVGLEIHEPPSLSEGGEVLEVGNVVTVEPGLYYQKIGGVRVEDLILVTENGSKNLTTYHKELKIEERV